MAKKTRLGLGFFFNNATNSGIVNYIYNIIAALKTLPLNEQPDIVLVHNETAPVEFIRSIGYDKLEYLLFKNGPSNLLLRKINSLIFRLVKKNYYIEWFVSKKFDSFYPYFPFVNKALANHPNKIEWLVDFNNMAFPNHYEDKGKAIQLYQQELTGRKSRIILSSNTLYDELKKYYPGFKNEVRILRFACSLPSLDNLDITAVKEKHEVTGIYFMSPNQFWEHKNQVVILQAIQMIKQLNPSLKYRVLFTGSTKVSRGKGSYAEKIKSLVEEYEIQEYVQFLGILERTEQLLLMRESIALIQPSLYEGWSTLVEEAKALNKFILLSDLPVHREQVSKNVAFFDPANAKQLAELMQHELASPSALQYFDYNQNILSFAKEIVQVLC